MWVQSYSVKDGKIQQSDRAHRTAFGITAKIFLALATTIAINLACCQQSYAYQAGVCEFEDLEDAADAINDAMMKNPDKWKGAVDTNGNGVADALESWNHAMSGGSMFGNYMCSEFAALSLCVLMQEYNCTDQDVKMVVGRANGNGQMHAVTGFRSGVIKKPQQGLVDGFNQIDFSWPDKNGIHIPNPVSADNVPIRDGIFNVAPQECADGFSVVQGSGIASGPFGSGGTGSIMQQALLSAMMSHLMGRLSLQNARRTPGIQDLYTAMQKKIKENERMRLETEQKVREQEATTTRQEQERQASPAAATDNTSSHQPTVVANQDGSVKEVPVLPDLTTESEDYDRQDSERARLSDVTESSAEIELPPDPAIQ
jgi:hypothetical protein